MKNLILEYLGETGQVEAVIFDVEARTYEFRTMQHHDEEPTPNVVFYAIQEESTDEGMLMRRIGSFTPKKIEDETSVEEELLPAWQFIRSLEESDTMVNFIETLEQQCKMHTGVNFISHFDSNNSKKEVIH